MPPHCRCRSARIRGPTSGSLGCPVPCRSACSTDVFFVQAGRGARNLRVDGSIVSGTHKLQDGAQIALRHCALRMLHRSRPPASGRDVGRDRGGYCAARYRGARAQTGTRRGRRCHHSYLIQAATAVRNRETKSGPSKAAIATGAAFVVLGAFAWFALTARSVHLQFEPPVEVMSVPGTLLKLKVGDRFMLRPGEHRVAAQLEGFYPLSASFTVGREQGQSVKFELDEVARTRHADDVAVDDCGRDARRRTVRQHAANRRRDHSWAAPARVRRGTLPHGGARVHRGRRRRASVADRAADAELGSGSARDGTCRRRGARRRRACRHDADRVGASRQANASSRCGSAATTPGATASS